MKIPAADRPAPIRVASNAPSVPVTAGWQPDPKMFGVGQVIKVVYEGDEQTATVTQAEFIGWDYPLLSHLYLPDRDEYVWVILEPRGH